MTRTEVAIYDIAGALARLQIRDQSQKEAIFVKSLESLVRFAISQHEVEAYLGAQNDMAQVELIRRMP